MENDMHMSTKPTFLSVMFLSAVMATGCSNQRSELPGPATPIRDPLGTSGYPRVIVSPEIEGLIIADRPRKTVEPHSGSMVVTLPVRSVYQGTLLIQYRAFFIAQSGEELNPDTPWRDMTLENGARRVIKARSLRDEAVDWRLEIRGFRR